MSSFPAEDAWRSNVSITRDGQRVVCASTHRDVIEVWSVDTSNGQEDISHPYELDVVLDEYSRGRGDFPLLKCCSKPIPGFSWSFSDVTLDVKPFVSGSADESANVCSCAALFMFDGDIGIHRIVSLPHARGRGIRRSTAKGEVGMIVLEGSEFPKWQAVILVGSK